MCMYIALQEKNDNFFFWKEDKKNISIEIILRFVCTTKKTYENPQKCFSIFFFWFSVGLFSCVFSALCL